MTYEKREKFKENKTLKTIRITLLVLYFILIILTTFGFIKGADENGNITSLTAFQMVVQVGGYANQRAIFLAIICSIFILFPAVEFFFCIFDKKSNVKLALSIIGSLVCIGLITFGIGAFIAGGALVSLLLYLLTFFLSVYAMFKSLQIDKGVEFVKDKNEVENDENDNNSNIE